MRNSKILAKIRNGQAARIALLGAMLPNFIAYAARNRFDGIWLDLEHRPLGRREVETLIAVCHLHDIDCMVRPASKEKTALYRYLEDGAAGLVVQHVNSVEEARDLVQSVKFPPVGDRGYAGLGLDTAYGLDKTHHTRAEILQFQQQETFLFVQIETLPALEQVNEIAAVPGVDGLYIGPSDLGIRINQLPEDQRIPMQQAVAQVSFAAKTNGIPWGIFPGSPQDVESQVTQGAKLLVWGLDFRLLQDGLAQSAAEIDAALDTLEQE